ncbi:MAG: hypothetical protein H0S80_07430 [Desulfovibrionaceae bacterium]|nr:hypothetical protein [Desulfovibrionaceae bacterium]
MTMGIGSLGGTTAFDQDTFGAAVVSKTLDYMNDSAGNTGYAVTDKASFGAAVASKTLDYMNSSSPSNDKTGMAQSYDFVKNVLSGHAASKSLEGNGIGMVFDASI